MPERSVNLALLWLAAAAFVSGWLSFAVGTPAGAWVPVAHGMLGVGLLALVPWKWRIARRGLRRRRPGRPASVALTIVTLAAVASGLALASGLASVGPLTTTQVHVGAGTVAVLLLADHLRRRPAGAATPDPVRRRLLRTGALAAAAALLWTGWEGTAAAARRFTGSHPRGSFDPARMPVTQWLDDSVPEIDPSAWTLRVGERELRTDELGPLERVRAVLDCTGAWYAVQDWGGVRLDRLVSPGEGRSVVVTSVTGYARRFPVGDLERLWLATEVAGEPLGPGHGAPVRIVAPGRRGFWWVKWVVSVQPSPLPWWVQSPFPLT